MTQTQIHSKTATVPFSEPENLAGHFAGRGVAMPFLAVSLPAAFREVKSVLDARMQHRSVVIDGDFSWDEGWKLTDGIETHCQVGTAGVGLPTASRVPRLVPGNLDVTNQNMIQKWNGLSVGRTRGLKWWMSVWAG
jgi:hypothetical protein